MKSKVNFRFRYGKFTLNPSLTILFIILMVIMFFFDYSETMTYVVWGCHILIFYKAVSPFCEKFFIENKKIHIRKLKFKDTILIPDDAVFILSYTTIGDSLIIKNRYMINIVVDSVEDVFIKLNEDEQACNEEAIRRGFFKSSIYDNNYIKGHFKNRWVYSFVYDDFFAKKLFCEQKKAVVIPCSLKDKIHIENNGFNVFYDRRH